MKIGLRTPSFKKSFSARTSGRATRAIKRALIPGYGKRGMGIFHPKRALYNKVYRKTTFSLLDIAKIFSGPKRSKRSNVANGTNDANGVNDVNGASGGGCTCLFWLLVAAMVVFFCVFL